MLEEDVRPGFGRFTEAATRTIRNAASRRIGNLREQLRQKRVLGASFAEDLITRTALEFAQEEEAVRARAGIAEIAASLEVLDRMASVGVGEIRGGDIAWAAGVRRETAVFRPL